ncbi:class I SAM-dependent methyltransferase [Streptomyces triticagri]|uniref:Class I SAM-dependent methyltransferase n=1 Tax=Streptomyces triticagri TaxID=2293568 RepID=A0A372M472_9ACTN|nr:class I SAM-dependent methyltransferase [Streptomyces triticagri]RFU85325.1 class I SAM-dependent methyltransferase [Streptomyces triticagri]
MTTPSATTPPATQTLARPTRLSDVKGWFFPADQLLFDWFLGRQRERGERGDLLELGAYLGKSAIFMGSYLGEGETFTVCDLFDSPAPDASNSAEMGRSYATLTRRAFEANYLSFHDELPAVVQGPSSVVTAHVETGSCRFVHIDASHLYEHVHGDIAAAAELLGPDGIVVLDDFRAEHCPGVAAATWGAVATTGLKPLCITATKFYGTWGAYDEVHEELVAMLRTRSDLWHGVEEVAGHRMIRISGKKAKAPAHPVSKYPAPEPEEKPADTAAEKSVPEPAAPEPAPEPGSPAPGGLTRLKRALRRRVRRVRR